MTILALQLTFILFFYGTSDNVFRIRFACTITFILAICAYVTSFKWGMKDKTDLYWKLVCQISKFFILLFLLLLFLLLLLLLKAFTTYVFTTFIRLRNRCVVHLFYRLLLVVNTIMYNISATLDTWWCTFFNGLTMLIIVCTCSSNCIRKRVCCHRISLEYIA